MHPRPRYIHAAFLLGLLSAVVLGLPHVGRVRAETDTPAFLPGAVVMVTADYLNLRTEPGAASGLAGALKRGDQAVIMAGPEPAGGRDWYQIKTESQQGWATARYLTLVTSPTAAAATPIRHETASAGTSAEAVVIDLQNCSILTAPSQALALRGQPSAAAPLLGILPPGASVVLLEPLQPAGGILWARIQSAQLDGWVDFDQLSPTSAREEACLSRQPEPASEATTTWPNLPLPIQLGLAVGAGAFSLFMVYRLSRVENLASKLTGTGALILAGAAALGAVAASLWKVPPAIHLAGFDIGWAVIAYFVNSALTLGLPGGKPPWARPRAWSQQKMAA